MSKAMLEGPMTILEARPKDALQDFLTRLREREDVNVDFIADAAVKTIKYLRGTKEQREQLAEGQELEQRWYKSLESGVPDYGVYATDYYLAELWACWIVYSRRYLSGIKAQRSLPPNGIVADLEPVNKIVDLGCGLGYTTAAMLELFPECEAFGTNMGDTVQMSFALDMSQRHGFKVVKDVNEIVGSADLIFASEYFEHQPEPIAHLRDVIRVLSPRALLVANAFGTRAIGHFETYNVDGKVVDGDQASTMFNFEMRRLGYQKVKTKLWNNRPAYWKKA